MSVEERLQHLSAEDLAPVVQRALHDESARPSSWEVTPLGWAAVNPATLGLYWFSGLARVDGEEVGWAAVLKVVGDVDLAGSPLDVGYLHDPQDVNYWRREAVALQSGLLDGWPGPLVPVRCLGVDETEPGVSWIWLEAQDGPQLRSQWTLEEQALLAHDLGAFAAQGAARAPSVGRHPWLVQRWLRAGLTCLRDVGVGHALDHDGCWDHPLIAPALAPGTRDRVRRLFGGAEELLAVLESLPTTLAHHDTQASNFFLRDPADADSRTVAIDWGFLGLAPVGHDLGCHFWSNICTWTVDPGAAGDLDRASTPAYLQGLAEFGWHGDERAVLFARAAVAALAITTYFTVQVSGLCDEKPLTLGHAGWPQELADRHRCSVESAVARWAAGLDYALDLGDEAHQLSKAF